jgi:hypothetical protein
MALQAMHRRIAGLDDGSWQARLPRRVDLKEETGDGRSCAVLGDNPVAMRPLLSTASCCERDDDDAIVVE